MNNILYLSNDLSQIGGIEKFNNDFITSLRDKEVNIIISQRKKGGIIRKINFLFNTIYVCFRYKPKYIIVGHLNFSIIAYLVGLIINSKYSINMYGIEILNIKSKIKIYLIKKAHKLIVISSYTETLIKKKTDIPKEKIFMLKSSISETFFYPIQNKNLLKKKYNIFGPTILTLSRLSSNEEKGQFLVLKSLKGIKKQFPNVKYIIAGPGKDERIDNYLSQNPDIIQNVHRIDYVAEEDKNDIYNLCDVFILLSKNEGFGIVFIEALASGCLVIATDGYGCKEGLLNCELGQVVNPDDTNRVTKLLIENLKRNQNRKFTDRVLLSQKTKKYYGHREWCKKVNSFKRLIFK